MKYIRLLAIIAVLTLVLSGCNVSTTSTGSSYPDTTATAGSSGPSGPTGGAPNWGVQTKTSGCVAHNGLQDSACTPGAIFPQATKDAICQSGYSRSVRNVPTSEKDQVYAEYGIYSHAAGEYEVDHLVSLELGGSNDISNLWPELASPQPGFHQKDQVENYLHAQVCSGAIPLKEAQIEIATNWLAVYDRMPKA
ncbi:MAG: HNH endonuclease signature motif containing protein [Ktedonobacteraceae bacterium]